MSHIDTHHVVNLTIATDDTALLDSLEAELPSDNDPQIGPEYDGPRRIVDHLNLADGEERLSARVTFIIGEQEIDGQTYNGPEEAEDLFTALKSYDPGSASFSLQHYISPVGATTVGEVREWYEEDPTRQPEDEDGEKYVPSSFDPQNHIIKELSG